MNNNNSRGLALVVDDDETNRLLLETLLVNDGFDVLLASNGKEAVTVFKDNAIDIVFMDVMMPVMDGYEATKNIKSLCGESDKFTPVIFLTALTDEDALAKCVESGGDDFLSKPFNLTILNSKICAMERVRDMSRKMHSMYERLHNDEEVAEKVFSNAVLANNINNSEIKYILKAADIFCGDMFISAYTPSRDINILLGDFTGHGLSSALGALPASEVFRAMSEKGFLLPEIISTINIKLCNLLPTSMFMACQVINIDHELEHISVYNCGMPPVYIKSGTTVNTVSSSCIPLGINPDFDFSQHIQYIDAKIGDRIIIASDGVMEALNDEQCEYGSERFLNVVNSDADADEFVIDKVQADMERYCGQCVQHDDVSLAEIRLRPELLPIWDVATIEKVKATDIEIQSLDTSVPGTVEFYLHTNAQNIRKLDPVPDIVKNIERIISSEAHSQSLFTILTELYVNAVDHGVLRLDSKLKQSPEGFALYFQNRENALQTVGDEYISINIKIKEHKNSYIIIIRIEDSGDGFDVGNLSLNDQSNKTLAFGRGISLVQNLCNSLHYELPGNIVEAVFVCEREL